MKPVRLYCAELNDLDEPPPWVVVVRTLSPFPQLLLSVVLVSALLIWSPIRLLPAEWRHHLPGWLPTALAFAGFVPAGLLNHRIAYYVEIRLNPGDFRYDRVMALAKQFNVDVKGVVELRDGSASAFARPDDRVAFTRGLLRCLEPSEVEAAMVHELAHIAKRHPKKMALSVIRHAALLIGIWFGGRWFIETHFAVGRALHFFLHSPIILLVFVPYIRRRVSRRQIDVSECEADKMAVDYVGNAEAYIHVLTKTIDYNRAYFQISTEGGTPSPSPTFERRIAAIRAYAEASAVAGAAENGSDGNCG